MDLSVNSTQTGPITVVLGTPSRSLQCIRGNQAHIMEQQKLKIILLTCYLEPPKYWLYFFFQVKKQAERANLPKLTEQVKVKLEPILTCLPRM